MSQKDTYYAPAAIATLERVLEAIDHFERNVIVEGDLWEVEWNPSNPDPFFTWEKLCSQLEIDTEITLAGVQTGLCVEKVRKELSKRGYRITVDPQLTMDVEEEWEKYQREYYAGNNS